jgi:prevent-host-death family protein
MQKIIGVTELQRHFRAVYDEVAEKRTPYVLTRGSRPEAVMIAYEDFLRYQQLDEQHLLSRFDRLIQRMAARNEAFSEEEIDADLENARAGTTVA